MRPALIVVMCLFLVPAVAQNPGGQTGGRGQAAVSGQTSTQQAVPIDPKKLCKIEGRTVNARTGEPIPRVTLSLTGSGQNAAGRSGRSDDAGHFLIENVAPASYRLVGERVGYLRQGYGSRTPGGAGAPLNLTDGQHLKDLEFRLTPQGVIMGQVLDESGDPLPRSNVAAYPVGSAGAVQAGPAGGARGGGGQFGQPSGGSAQANDIGEFRIAGLSPGRYHVVATSQGGGPGRGMGGRGGPMALAQEEEPGQAPMPTYYPSTTDSSAALPIEIAAGQDAAGINITIRKGALLRIQGRVMGGNPQEVAGVMLSLMPRGAGAAGVLMGRGGAQTRPDGTFEIARVQPGSYFILAQRMGGRGGTGIAGKSMVDVTNSDILGLLVPLTEPVSVSGSVKVEGQQATGLQRLAFTLASVDGLPVGAPSGRATDTGAFKIDSVFPDRYYLSVSGLPEGAYVKSVKLAGQEVIEKGVDLSNVRANATFDVLLSPKGATLDGTVTLDDKPATGSYIAVLADPVRAEQPYLNKFATADQNGRFTIKGLAPGDYKLYAFEEAMPQLSREPGLAKPYERRATKITLAEGSSERADLKAMKREEMQ
jgi:hypothetical protein